MNETRQGKEQQEVNKQKENENEASRIAVLLIKHHKSR